MENMFYICRGLLPEMILYKAVVYQTKLMSHSYSDGLKACTEQSECVCPGVYPKGMRKFLAPREGKNRECVILLL